MLSPISVPISQTRLGLSNRFRPTVVGSDQPFPWPDTMDLIVDADFLSDAEKTAILGGNLRRLLRIEL